MIRYILIALCYFTLIISDAFAASKKPIINSLSPSLGISGAQIVLRGSNFGSKTGKVRFGSVKARIQKWRSNRISAIIPTGAGTVNVTVTTGANKRSKAKSFVYQVAAGNGNYSILPVNDLGMHCVDEDFSVLSMLPPFNVVNAQVVSRTNSGPIILDQNSVDLSYSAVPDGSGSINSRSIGKTNFWTYVAALYGAALTPGVGLTGLTMPADATQDNQTKFRWSSTLGAFTANGVPIIPKDDNGNINRYPLLRVTAKDKATNSVLASTDVVLPVSEETTCATCHQTGRTAALNQGPTWASDSDKEHESRLNILLLHDFRSGTSLYAARPVLCASCHYSAALDLSGSGPSAEQQAHHTMSRAMHSFHSTKMLDPNGIAYNDSASNGITATTPERQACYTCHPGQQTKCLRGAMSDKLNCQNCHGGMSAVGGDSVLSSGGSIDGTNDGGIRRPWTDLPRCQSCHTGDANSRNSPTQPDQLSSDMIRFIRAFNSADAAASPIKATNLRFAEESNSLFRHSKGHGGILCEGCHGSTHAIWPNADALSNDNETAKNIQGHAGVISECITCHQTGSLSASLGGPHGLHPIGDRKFANGGHSHLFESNRSACQACHGADYRGTVLSKTLADRIFTGLEDIGTKHFAKGTSISCYSCHNGPYGD